MKSDRYYLELALEEAEAAAREKTFPIRAVLVDQDGRILSRGRNGVYSRGDFSCHVEIDAIRTAGSLLMSPQNKGNCTIYSTVEPCVMCSGAIVLAHIRRVVWACDDKHYGGMRFSYGGHYPNHFARIDVTAVPHPDLEQRSHDLMASWALAQKLFDSYWIKGTTSLD